MLNSMMTENNRKRIARAGSPVSTCAHSQCFAAEPPGKGVERIVDSEVKDGDCLHG